MPLIPESPNPVLPPNTPAGQTPATPAVPNVPSGQAAVNPAAPNVPSGQAAVNPAIPNTPTGIAAVDPAAPNASSAETAVNPSAPNTPTGIAAVDPAVPNTPATQTPVDPAAPRTLAALAPSGEIRSVQALFNFNAALGLPESVTYSRSSSASYLESYISPRNRLEKRITNDYVGSVENLVLYSENFDNAAWGKLDLTFIKKQNEFICLEGNSSSEHRLDQNAVAASNSTYTLTAKAYKGNRGIALRLGNNYTITFDLINGVVESNNSNVIALIKYVGDGFYDCSVFNAAPSNAIIRMNLSFNGSLSYQGDDVSGVILKKAQVTASTKPLPYVRTFDVSVTQSFTAKPRYEEKGLLVEGASTNLALRSEEFDNASWSKTDSTIGANESLSIDGSFSADKFKAGSTATITPDLKAAITSVVSTTYTFSLYVKASDAQFIQVRYLTGNVTNNPRANFDIVNGTLGIVNSDIEATITNVSNGWYRISTTVESLTTALTVVLHLIKTADDLRAESNAWTSGQGLFIWGAQSEALPFATSYIRTEGSTVSRAKDDVIADVSLAGNKTSIFCSYSHNTTEIFSSRISYSFNDGGFNNRFIAILNSSNLVNFQASASGVLQYNLFASGAGVDGTKTFDTVLIANNGNVTTYLDREQINTASLNIFPPNLNTLQLGSNLYGHINRMQVYDIALTANEVKTL
jgi:hypothetical protein